MSVMEKSDLPVVARIRFVEHRIGDRRIIRLIAKWLAAGVLEDGRLIETDEGTPQGWRTSTSIMSMINGSTSGGSDAPPARLLSCVTRTTVCHERTDVRRCGTV
jgi:hypothetical protein